MPRRYADTRMSERIRRNPLLFLPPPLLFVATLALAIGISKLIPILQAPPTIGRLFGYAGWLLVAAGIGLAAASLGLFARSHTTIVPHASPRSLVTSGPYRLTRNPMYVAFTLAYLGVAALTGSIPALPMLAVPLAILTSIVIPFEKRRLRDLFGQAYDDYCARVGRWL
jgi:protein-S-isoprenylcysteine O-methyltransferase Ste14